MADHETAESCDGDPTTVPTQSRPRLAPPVLVVHVDPAQQGQDVLSALCAPDGTQVRLVVGDHWPVGDAFGAFDRPGVGAVVVQVEATDEGLFELWAEALTGEAGRKAVGARIDLDAHYRTLAQDLPRALAAKRAREQMLAGVVS